MNIRHPWILVINRGSSSIKFAFYQNNKVLKIGLHGKLERIGLDGTPAEFEYWKTGTFHFCIQDPDIEALVEKILAHGGKQRMPIREYYPGKKPYKMVYVEDPFGLVFEIYTHSYELTYSQGAY